FPRRAGSRGKRFDACALAALRTVGGAYRPAIPASADGRPRRIGNGRGRLERAAGPQELFPMREAVDPRPSGLAGKLAFVTGAGRGIGAAVARELRAEGVRVVAADIEADGIEALARELGPSLRVMTLDVSDGAAVEDAVAAIEQDWGPIDLGVNVAGILATGSVIETGEAAWRRVFEVNTHGVFHVARALARRMTPRGRGAMVTVGSN